jgi:hypothetical protein
MNIGAAAHTLGNAMHDARGRDVALSRSIDHGIDL